MAGIRRHDEIFLSTKHIYLNRDVSKGLMEMGEKKKRGEDARNSRLQKFSRLFRKILEATVIVGRAVLFVVIVLAIELCVAGLCYMACGRW